MLQIPGQIPLIFFLLSVIIWLDDQPEKSES